MKILQVTPSYKPAYVYGGPIESVAKLCEGLTAAGHTVHVYTTTANGNTELPVEPDKAVLVDGVPVTYFKRITKDHTHISPALWRQLYKHCRDYDVVHIQSWWNILVIVAAIICHLRKVKVVISPRGMLSEYILTATNSKVKQLIHSVAGKKALAKSHFHATATIEYEECTRLIPGWKGFMLPNILTLPAIPLDKASNEVFTILFLSRIHPKKGIEFLLEALSLTTMPIKLRIAGSGEAGYIQQLKEKAAALKIEDKLEWIGWKNREEKFTELKQADLFVLVSHNENFANVVIEALHVGTPVLVSKQVGLAPFVAKEQMGWVVELDAPSIAQQLEAIHTATAQRKQIQERSRSAIQKLFSEAVLIKQYVQHYQQICSL